LRFPDRRRPVPGHSALALHPVQSEYVCGAYRTASRWTALRDVQCADGPADAARWPPEIGDSHSSYVGWRGRDVGRRYPGSVGAAATRRRRPASNSSPSTQRPLRPRSTTRCGNCATFSTTSKARRAMRCEHRSSTPALMRTASPSFSAVRRRRVPCTCRHVMRTHRTPRISRSTFAAIKANDDGTFSRACAMRIIKRRRTASPIASLRSE
jgi:hypothetical protein